MIRVAICINGLEVGGAETVLFELLRRVPDDMDVHVFSLIDGGALRPRIEGLGVPVTSLRMRRGVPSLTGLLRLTRELRRYRPDIVHTWLYHADLLGGLAARRLGIRNVIWHLHNNDLSPGRVRLSTRLVVRACARLSRSVPERILCCGEEVKRVHIERGYDAGKMVVEPNGVDVGRFRPSEDDRSAVRAELGIPDGVPVVGLIARFDPQKDHPTFFAAVDAFQRTGGDAFFLLAGRGVDERNALLVRLREALPRPEKVLMLGERADVPRLMAALDVATSSSLGEAFPVSLLEAMAAGLVCVVTDAGDSASIVADTGVVVQSGDPDALARGWAEALSLADGDRRDRGWRARERVKAHFTMERLAGAVWAHYREVVGDALASSAPR